MSFGQPRNPQERSLDRANRIVAALEDVERLLKEDGAGSSASWASVRSLIKRHTKIRDKRRMQLRQRREGER